MMNIPIRCMSTESVCIWLAIKKWGSAIMYFPKLYNLTQEREWLVTLRNDLVFIMHFPKLYNLTQEREGLVNHAVYSTKSTHCRIWASILIKLFLFIRIVGNIKPSPWTKDVMNSVIVTLL